MQPVVGEHVQRFNVVAGAAGDDRVGAARVVAEHSAQRAAIVGRRIRPEGQAVQFGGGAEVVEDHARLDAGGPPVRIHLHDAVEMAGDVHHHGSVRRLACQARPAAAKSDRSVVFAADSDDLYQVVCVERPDHSDGELAVVGGVGGVERPVAGPELGLAPDSGAQGHREGLAARVGCAAAGWLGSHPGSIPAGGRAGRGRSGAGRHVLARAGVGCPSARLGAPI